MAFDNRELRDCFGAFATGVMVAVTGFDDELHGLTINSFSSVSLDPPLLLFCIGNESRNLDVFKKTKSYCLNILDLTQKDLAIGFAKPNNLSKWNIDEYILTENGNPVFRNSAGFLECVHHDVIKAGDHHIFIGRVTDFAVDFNRKGLFYYKGEFLI